MCMCVCFVIVSEKVPNTACVVPFIATNMGNTVLYKSTNAIDG